MKKYKKLVSIPELKFYTEQCNIYTGKSMYMNFFTRHTLTINQLLNHNVVFHVKDDQMVIVAMNVQAPQSTTVEWSLDVDAKTTNYKELTTIISEFVNLLIHIKVQQLCINKKDSKFPWLHPDRIEVVMICCVLHLYKPTSKALKNQFNSKKV